MKSEIDVPATPKQPREVVVSDPLIGQKIEGYCFEKMLGQGAYGLVYLVVDEKEKNKRKAIKKIQSNEAHTDLIIVDMHHENVVKYFDHFIVTNHSYDQSTFTFIVTEYCENGDLSRLIKSKKETRLKNPNTRFTEREIFDWNFQATKGLVYLHSKKIIHRDIKPENIFLTIDNKVKIGDLGIAKILENSSMAETFAGTRPYMSPELFSSFNQQTTYTTKTDVWSLGCVLYEMIILEKAFPNGPYSNVPNFDQLEIPNTFKAILINMLKKIPKSRLNSEELYSKLLKVEKVLNETDDKIRDIWEN